MARLRDGGNQAGAGVADGGGAGVGDQGGVAVGQGVQQAGQLPPPVVLVAAEQARTDVEMGQQAAGDAGVLGGHQRHGGQDAAGAEGEVLQVADGGADDVESAHDGSIIDAASPATPAGPAGSDYD